MRVLQRVYGFMIRDFGYEGMTAYREVVRSAVVLAVSFVRSACFASHVAASGSLGPSNEMPQWQTLCNQLISSECNMYHSLFYRAYSFRTCLLVAMCERILYYYWVT